MPQDQALGHGITHRADADLQCAAVLDQAGDMQAGGIFADGHRGFRRRHQGKLAGGAVEHGGEILRRKQRLSRHKGQFVVDLPDKHKVRLACSAGGQHVAGHIGIAAGTVALVASIVVVLCHQLCQHIDAPLQQIAQGMGVVGADMVLLGRCHPQLAASQKEKFLNADIGGQGIALAGLGVVQGRVIPVEALQHRRQEAFLQIRLEDGFFQCQGGENGQRQGVVRRHPVIEGIGDMVGLAQPQGQGEHNTRANLADNVVRQHCRVAVER